MLGFGCDKRGLTVKNTKFLTTGEIAIYCDVNLRTVIRWIDKGSLKGYKLPGGGNNRVKMEDFIDFLHSNNLPIPDELVPSKTKILIIDDEPEVAKAIKRVTTRAGYDVIVACGGFQAGTMLALHKPALMTLDLSMPGLDGFDVIQFTKQESSIAQTKILVISALNQESLGKALQMGADAVLSKPFSHAELLDSITTLLAHED